jgi:dolichyl-phosphate beta-glucosyltransferase
MMSAINDFKNIWQGKVEVIIVDDGSNDGTSLVIKEHPNYSDHYFHLFFQENTGKGGALKLGVAKASGDFILTLDADMAASPLELVTWLSEKKDFSPEEILIGSREKNAAQVQDKLHRKFIGHVFNWLIRIITGLTITDTQCGFKLYENKVGKKLFANLQTLGWAHDVEILCSAIKANYTIIEMPITWKAVTGSKINVVRDSWNMFWEVIRIRFRMPM